MLIYHPAFDAYHCTFRLAALTLRCPSIDIDKARMIDFFLAFPIAVTSIHLPRELSWIRNELKRLANPYLEVANPKRTFAEMQHLQLASLGCLTAARIIDAEQLKSGMVVRMDTPLPQSLNDRASAFLARDGGASDIVATHLSKIPTAGPNGLKARSGLLEFRYDVI